MIDCRISPMCALSGFCKTTQLSGQLASNLRKWQEEEITKAQFTPFTLTPGKISIMVVGDYPDYQSDANDVAGIDDATQAIFKLIEKRGVDLDQVYFTYMVKCATPKRRAPSVKEIKACFEHISHEISVLQPSVILLIGAKTLHLFNLQKEGILKDIHGKVFTKALTGTKDEYKIVATFNPVMFLSGYNPGIERKIKKDIGAAIGVLSDAEIAPYYTPKWQLADSKEKFEEFLHAIQGIPYIAFDTESTALGWRKNPLLCLSFSWGENDKSVVVPYHQHSQHLASLENPPQFTLTKAFGALNHDYLVKHLNNEIFNNNKIEKVAHNIKYDMKVIFGHLGCTIKSNYHDTMLMHHLLVETPPHDLESLIDTECDFGSYSEEVHKITGTGKVLKNTYDKVPNEVLWPYAATDAEGVYRLAKPYKSRLQRKPKLWGLYLEEVLPLTCELFKAEDRGSLIDQNVLRRLFDHYQTKLTSLLVEMKKNTFPEFNPRSPPKLKRAFQMYNMLEACRVKTSASGYSMNKNKLNELKDNFPLAGQIIEYRSCSTMVSTYLNRIKDSLDDHNRIRFSFKQHGTVTGRLSCSLLHQIPKPTSEVNMREMFIAPQGYKYVYGDFSQAELWVIAILSNDTEMLRILHGGGDIHSSTAYEILQPVWYDLKESDISKFNRVEVGKRVNFGLSYGSQGSALVKTGKWQDKNGIERNFTWDMLTLGMKRWRSRFKGVSTFIDESPDIIRMNNSIAVSIYGRERHFGGALSLADDYQREAAEREGLNFRIQSVAASLTNRLINRVGTVLDTYIEQGKLQWDDIVLVNTVHDSVAYECKDKYVPWFTSVLRAAAEYPVALLNHEVFHMDIGTGVSWGEAERLAE